MQHYVQETIAGRLGIKHIETYVNTNTSHRVKYEYEYIKIVIYLNISKIY